MSIQTPIPMSATLELTKQLIAKPSVTPDDLGCQDLMIERLKNIGFTIEKMRFGNVDNFWARRGDTAPLMAFAGHTDVVPTGPIEDWLSPPFEPEIRDGLLYGRGTADMKGSLAAMVTACEDFVEKHPDHKGSIAFLITSDEEGIATEGTIKVIQTLEARNEKMDYCLVGEPSSTNRLGDIIKNGRRGSLNAWVKIMGKQGHVAYPHLAKNPLHAFSPILQTLINEQWDQGNEHFPATSFQVSNLNVGTGAENVIPGTLTLKCNWRFSTELTAEQIKQRFIQQLDKGDFSYHIDWRLSGNPFLTPTGALVDAAKSSIKKITGFDSQLSTSGGTSDGRFIAPTGAQVLELGPLNATIHQTNECVSVEHLDQLSAVYASMLEYLLTEAQQDI